MDQTQPTHRMMRTLADEFPEVAAMWDEHVAFYDELLVHVLMGDIWIVAKDDVRAGRVAATDFVRRFVERLEEFYASEPQDPSEGETLRNLIGVSFLEGWTPKLAEKFRPLLGPEMRAQLDLDQAPPLVQREDGLWVRPTDG
jgi:hypothetical protein